MRDRLLEEILSRVVVLYGEVKVLKADMATKQEFSELQKKLDHVTIQVARNTERSIISKSQVMQLENLNGMASKSLTIVSK